MPGPIPENGLRSWGRRAVRPRGIVSGRGFGYGVGRMKIYATYGLIGALLGALQMLVLFFLGLHGEKIHLLNDLKVSLPLGALGFVLGAAVLVLGLRAWREAQPDKAMSYGRGVGGGCLIGLWQGLGTMVFTIVYGFVINPGFKDAMVANTMAQMQAKNLPAEGYAMAEKMMNITLNPIFQGIMAVPGSIFIALIASLIAAAVLKREAAPAQPPLV